MANELIDVYFSFRFSAEQIRSPCFTQVDQPAQNGNTIFSTIKLDTVQRNSINSINSTTNTNSQPVNNSWPATDYTAILNQNIYQTNEVADEENSFGAILDLWTMDKTMDSFCPQISFATGEEMLNTPVKGEFRPIIKYSGVRAVRHSL